MDGFFGPNTFGDGFTPAGTGAAPPPPTVYSLDFSQAQNSMYWFSGFLI